MTISGNKPITVGQGYSTIAWVPEDSGSWGLPLRHEWITSYEHPIDKAAWQLQQVCKHLPDLFLYGIVSMDVPLSFQKQLVFQQIFLYVCVLIFVCRQHLQNTLVRGTQENMVVNLNLMSQIRGTKQLKV